MHQLVEGEKLTVVAGVPAHKRQVVDQRLGQVALLDVVAVIRVAIALGQLVLRVAHDGRQVDVLRDVPAEGLIEQVILRRGGEVFHTAHDVGDAHQVVVDDVREIVGGHAIRLDQHHIVQRVVGHGDVAEYEVVITGLTFGGRVHADDVGDARGQLGINFLLAQMQAVLVVLEDFSTGFSGFTAGVQLFLGAEAVVGVAGLDQLLGIGEIQVFTLGLDIWADRAADIRALVPLEPALAQRVINDVRRAFHIALLVGVLDAQDELAAVLFRQQVSVQRRANAAQVHKAGGRGGKSCSHFHLVFPSS